MNKLFALLSVTLLVACAPSPPPAAADAPIAAGGAGHTETHTVQNDKGAMVYDLYVPAGYNGKGDAVPLIVALHGGNDSTAATAIATGWNALADQNGFLVAYPQEDANNGRAGIWDWSQVPRDGREDRAASLVALVTTTVSREFNVDTKRVMITGMSAGAGMAVAVGIAFDELYAAVGAETGCAWGYVRCQHPPACWTWGCNTDGLDTVYTSGEDSGAAAYQFMGGRAHRMPAIISSGSLDAPGIGTDQQAHIQMWTSLNDWIDDGEADLSVPRDSSEVLTGNESKADYTRTLYRDASACVVAEQWLIDGMQHDYSGRRDANGVQGLGPDLRREQFRFLMEQTSKTPGC